MIVVNRTHLLFEQVSVDFNSTIDKFWLVQNNHGPRIGNWECKDGYYNNHPTCKCPLPFHYVTVAVFGGVFIFIVIAMSIYFCTKCCHICRCCQNKCCTGSAKCYTGSAKCCDSFSVDRGFCSNRSRLKETSSRFKLLDDDEEEDLIIWLCFCYIVHISFVCLCFIWFQWSTHAQSPMTNQSWIHIWSWYATLLEIREPFKKIICDMPSICKTFISNKLIFYIMFLYIVYHKVVCSYDMSSHGFLRYHCCHVTMF